MMELPHCVSVLIKNGGWWDTHGTLGSERRWAGRGLVGTMKIGHGQGGPGISMFLCPPSVCSCLEI